MSVYALTVLYNGPIDEERSRLIQSHGLIPVYFDNSTSTSSIDENKAFCAKHGYAYFGFQKNVGLPKAYNFVIKKLVSPEDWIIILDQDTPLPEEYFEKMLHAIHDGKHPVYMPFFKLFRPGKYGPNIIKKVSSFNIIKNTRHDHLQGYLLGINSCTAISGKIFEKVGYFNERLFLDYVDDDFFMRLAQHKIESETIGITMTQNFFTNAKNTLPKIKVRFANIKADGRVFFKEDYIDPRLSKILYFKEMLKFEIKFALKNNPFYFFPLFFLKPKSLNRN